MVVATCPEDLRRIGIMPKKESNVMTKQILKNVCRACSAGCGVNVTVENGKMVKIEGNPEFQITKGGLCPRAVGAADVISAHDRLLYPLKRNHRKPQLQVSRLFQKKKAAVLLADLPSKLYWYIPKHDLQHRLKDKSF